MAKYHVVFLGLSSSTGSCCSTTLHLFYSSIHVNNIHVNGIVFFLSLKNEHVFIAYIRMYLYFT